ncbi:MAG: hypothetical protein ACFFE4_02230 [Candidatus Thorarchaeota archaeon]
MVLILVVIYGGILAVNSLPPNAPRSNDFDIWVENDINYIKTANNDTTAPMIKFVKPDINNTSIKTSYYEFIVNITDANPPLPGNVTIEISNASTSYFNASMLYDQDNLWFFLWENLTSYPNEQTYTIRVRATDSSSNKNEGLSNDLFILMDVYSTRTPDLLNAVFYVIAAIVIIALVMVYLNKKRTFLKTLDK